MKLSTLTFALAFTSATAFAPLTACSSSGLMATQHQHGRSVTPLRMSESSSEEADQEEEEIIVPSLENSVIPPPSMPQPRRLDPLVQSLTRSDVDTSGAETRQLPFLGEVVMDRSLYLLVPAAAFAVIGFLFSIYIGLTSKDEWVIKSEPAVTPTTVKVGSDCRGLCSNADQDLEGLRSFMQSLTK